MLGVGVHCPKDATLPSGPNHTRHIKTQSFNIAYDEPSSLNDRLAKWAILLSQYEMQFLPQKVVKEQAVATSWLSIQIQERSNFMKISQMRSLKFA